MAIRGKIFTAAAITGSLLAGSLVVSAPAAAQWRGGDRDRYDNRYQNPREAERMCVNAVERQGGRRFDVDVRRANVTRIRDGYRVTGQVRADAGRYNDRWDNGRRGYDDRRSYDDRYGYNNGRYGDTGSFTCSVRYGRVQDVRINGIRGLR